MSKNQVLLKEPFGPLQSCDVTTTHSMFALEGAFAPQNVFINVINLIYVHLFLYCVLLPFMVVPVSFPSFAPCLTAGGT